MIREEIAVDLELVVADLEEAPEKPHKESEDVRVRVCQEDCIAALAPFSPVEHAPGREHRVASASQSGRWSESGRRESNSRIQRGRLALYLSYTTGAPSVAWAWIRTGGRGTRMPSSSSPAWPSPTRSPPPASPRRAGGSPASSAGAHSCLPSRSRRSTRSRSTTSCRCTCSRTSSLAEWAPLLCVLGLTPAMAAAARAHPGRADRSRIRSSPSPIWLATYYAWHLPWAYDAALDHQWTILHLEHATYFAAGCPALVAGRPRAALDRRQVALRVRRLRPRQPARAPARAAPPSGLRLLRARAAPVGPLPISPTSSSPG